jgi:Dullard-like phosphatase family protein
MPLLPPLGHKQQHKKTLILDLDNTLIHSTFEGHAEADFTFSVEVAQTKQLVMVRQRPHLHTFLERASKLFEIVVFTASQKVYAEQLLDIIDPNGQYIKFRLYRDSCLYWEGHYFKDLTVLGRDLAHTLIIDDCPHSYGLQLGNGVPIKSWCEDDDDDHLLRLIPFLEDVARADDVRPLIKEKFKLRELVDSMSALYLVSPKVVCPSPTIPIGKIYTLDQLSIILGHTIGDFNSIQEWEEEVARIESFVAADEQARKWRQDLDAKLKAVVVKAAAALQPYSHPITVTTTPTTGKLALLHHSHLLTPYERQEIWGYDEVFFVGHPSTRKILGHGAPDMRNHGYDDDYDNYQVVIGDHIAYRYEVMGLLGRGTFGSVLHCIDHSRKGQHVAVKVVRNIPEFHRQAQAESYMLNKIQMDESNDGENIVKAFHAFEFRSHRCFTFEKLDTDLHQHHMADDFKPQTTAFIWHVAEQVLKALDTLHRLNIIHADLKLDNIMLQRPHSSDVKLIDFGQSCFADRILASSAQARAFRAPEVVLGQKFGLPIDMWSFGCILAQLATGEMLFPARDEEDLMALIIQLLGCPSALQLSSSPYAPNFFDVIFEDDACAPIPIQWINDDGSRREQKPGEKTLEQFLKGASMDKQFVDLLKRCLVWDPDHRITASEALQHPFITGCPDIV